MQTAIFLFDLTTDICYIITDCNIIAICNSTEEILYNYDGRRILEAYGLNKKYIEELVFDIEQLKTTQNKIINKFGESNFIDYELKQKTELYFKVYEQIKIVESIINNLEQPSKNVLYYKYIKHLQNTNIALKMNYSEPRIYQLVNKALNEFNELYSNLYHQTSHIALEQDYSKL